MPKPTYGTARGIPLAEAYMEIGTKDIGFTKGLAGAAAITTSFTTLLTGAVAAAANFEKQMAMVHTLLFEGNVRFMEPYARRLQELAVIYADSTQSLSKGLYDVLSATIPANRALGVLQASARAGAAGMTTTAVAADAITTILNSYGLAASRATDISDMLFSVVVRGKTTFAELVHQIGQAAAGASVAGLTLEEFGASISTITRAGIPTSRAMTSLSAILRSFLAPTRSAIKLAKQFNLQLSVGTVRRIGLLGVLKQLKNASAEELRGIFRTREGTEVWPLS